MTYRDELEAAEARVEALEVELEDARELRDELAGKEIKPPEPEPEPKEPIAWPKLLKRVGIAALAAAALFAVIATYRYCDKASIRDLDGDRGDIEYAGVVDDRRMVVVSRQRAYHDDHFDGDRRISVVDLATGAVTRSRRLVGGRGTLASRIKFHGRYGELLWFETKLDTLHAHDLYGKVVITTHQVKRRLPRGKQIGSVVASDGLYVGMDDGYWYRVGESEAARVAKQPEDAEWAIKRKVLCRGDRVSVVVKPGSPDKHIVYNDRPIANTSYLEIEWLQPWYSCPFGEPPAFLFRSRSKIDGPFTARLVGVDGVERWSSAELGALAKRGRELTIVDDHLIGLPSNKVPGFSASLATGKIRWKFEPREF